jgi:hypothetical protein
VVEGGGGQTLLRMSGWRGMSIELLAELDTSAGRLLLYLDWWAQLTATRLRLVTPFVHGRGLSVELVAELDTSAGRLLLHLDWWAQLTATSLRLHTEGHCA